MSRGDSITQTVAAPLDRSLVRLQWAVGASAAAILVLVVARIWHLEGLLRRVTIDGPSMAPTLCGPHYDVTCGDCRFQFRCDADLPPTDLTAVCPNCGFAKSALDQLPVQPPDRVLIDRWGLIWRQLRRGEVVAARVPSESSAIAVKRTAAFSGERLAIQDGEQYVGETLVRKTLEELREVRQLVHDNDFQPQRSGALPPRWRGESGISRWRPNRTAFRYDAIAQGDDQIDWLQYHHGHGTANPLIPRTKEVPILDNDSYNQGPSPRELNPVSDVHVSCRLRASGNGQLAFVATDGGQRFEIVIAQWRSIRVQSGGQTLLKRSLDSDLRRHSVDVEFGLCDQQVFLAIEGRQLVRLPYERADGSPREALHPLAIGVSGLEAEVEQLRVWRDIYYLDPQGLPRAWQSPSALPAAHVALLGDNQPVSIDSRHWDSPAVSRRAILGRVYRAFWLDGH